MNGAIKRFLPRPAVDWLRAARSAYLVRKAATLDPAEYWTGHHVASPDSGFRTVEDSLAHYRWRNHVNLGQLELMPVGDVSGKTVLDYGCGPGNDVIGFGHYSQPARLLACDVSSTAIKLAQARAQLHGIRAEFSHITENPVVLPYEDASIDVIHSAGVIHHTSDPAGIFREFRRVLRPDGEMRIMVYNRNSIWMHLYVAYVMMIERGLWQGLTLDEAFSRSTDGEACPIARGYRPEEFLEIGRNAGFTGAFVGAGITITEMELLPRRWAALSDPRLRGESREFLYNLTFDERGWPVSDGAVAGVNAYFRFHVKGKQS
jgi:ubiquinone/menaquinone biosynthesis C-methylase UbiE